MAHLVIDLYNVATAVPIGNAKFMAQLLDTIATNTHLTVLGRLVHQFQPDGATAILLLAESHLSAHTWPEKREAHLDFYHCGSDRSSLEGRLEAARRIILEWLPADRCTVETLIR